MEPVKIKELCDTEKFTDQEIVKCVQGKLIALFPVKKGSGTQGDYEYQNGELQDGSGKIKICFSSSTQPQSAKGKTITITSVKTESHGLQGVKIVDREYQDKNDKTVNTRELRITSSADIVYSGQSSGGSSERQQSTGGGGGGGGAKNQAQAQHPQVVLDDMIALHQKCFVLVNDTYGAMKLPPESIAAFTATLFIEGNKQGLGYDFAKRIAASAPKVYPAAPDNPKKWRDCVIPKGEYEGKTLADIPDDALLKLFSYYDDKGSETAFAKCVYSATIERDVIPKKGPPESDPPDDDFPA